MFSPRLLSKVSDDGKTMDFTLRMAADGIDWYRGALDDIKTALVCQIVAELMPVIRKEVAQKLDADELVAIIKEGLVQAVTDVACGHLAERR